MAFIPTPPAPPETPNFTTIYEQMPLFEVAAGTTLYGRNIGALLNFGAATFRNAGAIFADLTQIGSVLRVAPNNTITTAQNSGTIVFRGLAQATYIQVFDEARSFVNSGEIYATTVDGTARIFQSFYSQTVITNSGLLVVAANSSHPAIPAPAIAISLPNGGLVTNTATGRILAEGKSAVGVSIEFASLGAGLELDNAGLIEAHGLDGKLGIGVRLDIGDMANSGTIRSEVGIAVIGATVTNTGAIIGSAFAISANEAIRLDNRATGWVYGGIAGGNREDRIDNAGLIQGNVRAYDGNDTIINTAAGRITGVVDLGLGDDSYVGGDGLDRVAPDNGADTLDGRGGNDLLLGGNDNDRLIGGLGNDGLYGERGDDVIVTLGGDEAVGGKGNDRIELGDLSFALVDGGEGIDTLVLPAGEARVLDLSAVLASGRVTGIEAFALAGGGLVVRAADVAAGATLRIDGTAAASVSLVGGWTLGAASGGYQRYLLDGRTVEVSTAAAVAVVASAPAGAVGLDAIAGGDPALRPGAESGVDLTPDFLFVSYLELYEPTIIPEGDNWFTTGTAPALYAFRDSARLTVAGTLLASNDVQASAMAVDFTNLTRTIVEATGSIVAESSGAIERPVPDYFPVNREGAYAIHGGVSAVNHGFVGAYSLLGVAMALGEVQIVPATTGMASTPERHIVMRFVADVTNTGTIEAQADASWAAGVIGAVTLTNSGVLSVAGAKGAIGVLAYTRVENSGSIVAASPGTAIGVLLQPSAGGYTVRNTGHIGATVAVMVDWTTSEGARPLDLDNSGTIVGRVQAGDGADTLKNTGTINGEIRLAGGDDRFDGTGAVQGQVFGEFGNDTLTGGRLFDYLDGGDGDDVLTGGADGDRLVGGAGVDTASYADDLGAVFVNLTLATGSGNAAAGDTYASIENVTGSVFNDTIIGEAGANRLNGRDGDDRLIGALGADVIVGGSGVDIASYEDNQGVVFVNLTLNRGYNNAAEGDSYDGIENLLGGLFDDVFIGNELNNRLDGAMGADTLVGAGGADVFVFAHAPGETSLFGGANVDTILDFTSAVDKIELSRAAFGPGLGIGTLSSAAFTTGIAATTAEQRIVYDGATGRLYYDADGSGAGAAVLFAVLDTKPVVAAGDFVIV